MSTSIPYCALLALALASSCRPSLSNGEPNCTSLAAFDNLYSGSSTDTILRGSIRLIASSGDTLRAVNVPQRGTWTIDLKRLEEVRPGGMTSKLRLLPKIEICDNVSLDRYMSMSSAIDVGMLVGIRDGLELVYVASATWRAGLVCRDFIQIIDSCGIAFDTVLKPGLPIPDPPFRPESTLSEILPPREKLGPGILVWENNGLYETSFDLYNLDATLWENISLPKDLNRRVQPYAYHKDYSLLAFKCSAMTTEGYVVFVNEQDSLKKLILRSSNNFKFYSWKDHLLKHVFSVQFRTCSHKIYKGPSDGSRIIPIKERQHGYDFLPVEVKNDWLKVSWDIGNREPMDGWVRWRRNDTLLINLFYIS